ncbi:MAG: carbon-nitrogen hydrolase family protein [Microbacterium sp.]
MRTLCIAAIQTGAVPRDLAATWAHFEGQVRQVVKIRSHVDLIVVPELLLAAPGPLLVDDPDFDARAAESIPGALTDRLGALAAELGVWLVPGSLVERGPDGRMYNTAIAISPTGEVIATYRKLFPWRPYEDADPGRDFTTFDIPGVGRIGLAICFDGSFPEVARQLAWLGAEVIIQPTLTTTRDREMEVVMSRANAFANQVFVVNVNGAPPSGVGESVIVDPEGTIMQHASNGEEVLFGVLDLDRVSQVRTYGTFGLNRPWSQLADQCALVQYPMFGGATFVAPAWATPL